MTRLKQVLNTDNVWGPFFVRLFLGVVLFPHGMQKLLGWFGGPGFTDTMTFFIDDMAIPGIIAFLIIILESIGSIALIAGFATRIVALGYLGLVLGIIFMVHLQYGFFMNWYGDKAGEGIEYFLFWLGMSTSLVFSGGGKYSLDRLLSK